MPYCLHISTNPLDSTITIEGRVQDFVTHVDVPGCLVEVLNANDSSVVASTKALEEYQNGEQSWKTSEYRITIPRKEGDYILRVTEDGFYAYLRKAPTASFLQARDKQRSRYHLSEATENSRLK